MKIIEHQTFSENVEFEDNTIVQFCYFNNGATLRGDNILFRHNIIQDADTGITIYGDMNTVMMNRINRFKIDGIRILSSFNAVTDNIIKGSVLDNPDNHNDGIQIWSDWSNHDDEISGINVSRNILLLSGSEVSTQGIIATDCTVSNSTFRDNLVDVNHWHGLTLNSAENCLITGNITTNTYGDFDVRQPWIKLVEDLGGNVVEDNTTTRLIPQEYSDGNRIANITIIES